jgi:hypothetical protein
MNWKIRPLTRGRGESGGIIWGKSFEKKQQKNAQEKGKGKVKYWVNNK